METDLNRRLLLTLPKTLFSLALLSLGLSLGYFSYSIVHAVNQAPAIMADVENVSRRIDSVLEEGRRLGPQLDIVMEQVQRLQDNIPLIVNEVEANRLLVPSILESVSLVRKQIPPILAEVEAYRAVLPQILDELQAYRLLVPELQKELLAYRELAPSLLEEMAAVRLMVPQTMDRADSLVENMKQAGQDASEGAVVGVISGILKSPITLVGNFGKAFRSNEITKQDIRLMKETAESVLQKPPGSSDHWYNPTSKHKGVIRVVSESNDGGNRCRILHMTVNLKDRKNEKQESEFCLNDKGKWIPKKK